MKIPRLISILLLVLGLVSSGGCAQKSGRYYEEREVIGTFVRVDICREGHEQEKLEAVMKKIWDRFEEIESRMNAYDSASEVGAVNAAKGKPIVVHRDVYFVIRQSIKYFHQTEGAFDITVRPLIEMWQGAELLNKIPGPPEVAFNLKRVGLDRIQLLDDLDQYRVSCQDCKIDLGGIAKGFAVDEAAGILRENGFDNFMINAGGDMYVSGTNCREAEQDWRVAIQHPRDRNEWADILEVSHAAVTTSGDYEQFYEIEGQKFSHIINPKTGYPQEHIVSATVIAPTAMEADVYSTALTIWTVEQGIAFIDALGEDYAALILKENDRNKIEYYPSAAYRKLNSFKVKAGKL